MGFLDFDPDGAPEIKIIRNSIINDNRSPPPALFVDESVSGGKVGVAVEFNKNKFIRKEDFGACVLDRTGIYIVNKSGLKLLREICDKGVKFPKEKLKRNKKFFSRLIQYNILVVKDENA